MGNACERLDRIRSACELSQCVSRVTGLRSNSVSPTDTWILEFKQGTRYEDERIGKAFLKLWLTGESITELRMQFNSTADASKVFRFPAAIQSDQLRGQLRRKIKGP